MDSELKGIIIICVFAAPIGLIGGLFLTKRKPEWCKIYIKFCLDKKWWVFLFGLLLFSGLSAKSFSENHPYHGWYFTAFALLNAYTLVKCGFRPLSPEIAAKIDASDPTQIFSKAPPKQKGEVVEGKPL